MVCIAIIENGLLSILIYLTTIDIDYNRFSQNSAYHSPKGFISMLSLCLNILQSPESRCTNIKTNTT